MNYTIKSLVRSIHEGLDNLPHLLSSLNNGRRVNRRRGIENGTVRGAVAHDGAHRGILSRLDVKNRERMPRVNVTVGKDNVGGLDVDGAVGNLALATGSVDVLARETLGVGVLAKLREEREGHGASGAEGLVRVQSLVEAKLRAGLVDPLTHTRATRVQVLKILDHLLVLPVEALAAKQFVHNSDPSVELVARSLREAIANSAYGARSAVFVVLHDTGERVRERGPEIVHVETLVAHVDGAAEVELLAQLCTASSSLQQDVHSVSSVLEVSNALITTIVVQGILGDLVVLGEVHLGVHGCRRGKGALDQRGVAETSPGRERARV